MPSERSFPWTLKTWWKTKETKLPVFWLLIPLEENRRKKSSRSLPLLLRAKASGRRLMWCVTFASWTRNVLSWPFIRSRKMPLAYKPPIFLSRPSSPVVLDYGFTTTWTTWGVIHFIWTQIQLCGGLVSHRSLKAIFWGEMTDELDLVDGSRDCIG